MLKLAIALGALGCAYPLAALDGPSLDATAVVQQSTRSADILPQPSGPLSLELGESATMKDLLARFAELTGATLVLDGQVGAQLSQAPLLLGVKGEVPKDEVYPFVEGLLSFQRISLALIKGGARPLLGAYHGNNAAFAPRLRVTEAEVERFAAHSALLVETTLTLDALDVRELAAAMRSLVTDSSTQAVLPAGTHGMILRGTGADIASFAAFARTANASARQ